jgi:hypothetical protein
LQWFSASLWYFEYLDFIHTPPTVHPWKDVVSTRHDLLELREELQEACSIVQRFIGQQVQHEYGWYDS